MIERNSEIVTASPTQIRVVLVDDHAVMRAGLRMLIESYPQMRVVGEAGNGADAVALVAGRQPEIILVELDLNGTCGLEFLTELRVVAPRSRVIILTGLRDSETHRQALRLGAKGVVLKTEAAEVLLKAIQKVHAGEMWIGRLMMGEMIHDVLTPGPPKQLDGESLKIAALTKREREVLALVGAGLKNKQIAESLFISETTVRHHVTSIFGKLDCAGRLELLLYAFRHRLAKPPA